MFPKRYRRGSIERFVERHETLWELAMGVLTVVYVGVGFVADDQDPMQAAVILTIEVLLSAIFLGEFTVRFLDSRDRPAYFRHHWIDFVTAIPLVGPLRVLRFLRLLRMARLASHIRRVCLGHCTTTEQFLNRESWLLGPTLILLWVFSAYSLWLAEHGVNPNVHTFGQALLQTALTTMTLGYGNFKAATVWGQLIFGFDVFAALGLVGVASARLTSAWLGADDRRTDVDMNDLARQIRELQDTVLSIQASTQAIARTVGGVQVTDDRPPDEPILQFAT